MSRQPTLKQLKYLCAVAEHQHFGHAAKACHVSQSTLSAGVVELEETLGATLVERNHRNVLLTTLGIDVVARATDILVSVDELVSVCEAAGQPFHGKMRMGVIPTIAPFLLPGLLTRLREEYPDFMLYIREDLSENLVQALQAGELDVLLLALPFAADNVDVMPLLDDPFYLTSRPDHPLAKRAHLKTRDLDGEDVLLLEDGHCLRDHALEACRLRETQISVPYQATSLSTIVQMVANGIGITLLPKMAIDTGITSGTDLVVRPFEQAEVQRSIGLMWRKKTPRQHEFRLLGEFMQVCQKT